VSVLYYTPQRMVTGHLSRYVRRTAGTAAAPTAQPQVHAWFDPQMLSAGERETVSAQFAAGAAWTAVSATFTLWAAGSPAAGYNGAAAALTADPSGRLYTIAAVIDLTSGAEYPLDGGIYYGEFLVASSTGLIIAARGQVTILTPEAEPPPGDYQTGGGVG